MAAQCDPANLVELKIADVLFARKRVDVDPIGQPHDVDLHALRGVLHHVLATQVHGFLAHPHQHRFEVVFDVRLVVGAHDHVAAADIDFMLKGQRDD